MSLNTCKNKFLLAAFVCLAAVTTSAHAVTVRLDTLLAPGTNFTSGDKIFDNFSYTANGNMPLASNINVVSITDNDGNHGIRFQAGFADNIGGGRSDALITFDVQVADPSKFVIVGVNMKGNPLVTGPAGVVGLAIVTETFTPAPESLQIYHTPPDAFDGVDSVMFANTYTKLSVQKDILLESMVNNAGTGFANLSFLDQTFVQQMVPEPASLGLAGFGVLGLLLHRRRRS